MKEKSAPDNSYWGDKQRLLYNKDCRHMSELSDESIQMVVTSPPYWGLRKYAGLPDLVWGGQEDCQHEWGVIRKTIKHHSGETNPGLESHFKDAGANDDTGSCFCSICGAWQGQLGLEPSPELYISHLVEILREIRRVLRKDGCVFLNIGDSYVSGKSRYSSKPQTIAGKDRGDNFQGKPDQYYHPFLKDKDLCLIPFRLAIALQEDGWWVRSVIIWAKNNPMPESVRDRPSESHEYILMLTKSAHYYYDQEAVREPQQPSSIERAKYDVGFFDKRTLANPEDWNDPRRLYGFPQKRGYKSKHGTTSGEQEQFHGQNINTDANGRNLRSVWTFPTQSYKEAHFATYPEELVRRCVLAGTPEVGCCPNCGKAWARMIERYIPPRSGGTDKQRGYVEEGNRSKGAESFNVEWAKHKAEHPDKLLGWKAQCKCGLPQSENIGSIVLDPFAGSGTTLAVAKRLGRQSVGYELSEEYCKLAVKRIEKETAPMRL